MQFPMFLLGLGDAKLWRLPPSFDTMAQRLTSKMMIKDMMQCNPCRLFSQLRFLNDIHWVPEPKTLEVICLALYSFLSIANLCMEVSRVESFMATFAEQSGGEIPAVLLQHEDME